MKARWISLFASAIASGATTEKIVLIPRPGRLVGVQLTLSMIVGSPSNSSCWVSQTPLGGTFTDGSPIIAYLAAVTFISGLTLGYQASNSVYVPQNLPVSVGQGFSISVTDTGATSSVYAILQLEVLG